MENIHTRFKELEIDGTKYIIQSSLKPRRKSSPLPENVWTQKFAENKKQRELEVDALKLMFGKKFTIEKGENYHKYSIEFFVRGGQDAYLRFTLPSEYPSDSPPNYTLDAPWMREKQRKELFQDLTRSYTENFGSCLIHYWAEIIATALKDENALLKGKGAEPDLPEVEQPVTPIKTEEDTGPCVYEGTPIWDRSSCFSPYLAVVKSENDVKKFIEKIEKNRKVATAWRNTYAYRYKTSDKIVEVGEDGGEPKAGRNLLQRLINYEAVDLIVYISRRVGGSLLGSDRFRHLNDAADDVLVACGYKKTPSKDQKNSKGSKKKDKKLSKMRK